MKLNRKIAIFLSVLALLCAIASVSVFAADDDLKYFITKYDTAEEKLATMGEPMLENGGSQLYVEKVTGEIALVDTATGQILFSNPYNIAASKASDNIKGQLMSQLIVNYNSNGVDKILDSYASAAALDQITVKKTKGGVRVEYIIGEQVTRRLVPQVIPADSFKENIYDKITDTTVKALFEDGVYYQLMAPDRVDENGVPLYTKSEQMEMKARWPITEKMEVYVFDAGATSKELDMFEKYIKQYAPAYTFEKLDEDHEKTEYEGEEQSPPLFRMALEYTLDDDGNLDVRLPANGIRFDETLYSLSSIQILPYFGAGTTADDGEIFIPDGSGAIIRPAEFGGAPITLTNVLYGQDYAYQKIGGAHQESMRLPVYGVVQNIVHTPSLEGGPIVEETLPVEGEAALEDTTIAPPAEDPPFTVEKIGFLAIVNEGDSLASITASNGGNVHQYFTAFTSFSPRPKDSYNLSESIAGAGDAVHVVTSDRKYTDSYRIKYVMLNDEDIASEKGVDEYFEPSYVGMAKAYRSYLEENGVLAKLTSDEVKDDIPLYIESFGAIETTKRIASIPVTVLEDLTTFEDLKNMTANLNESGIKNVNYRLTGFTNGGMISTIPYKVNFEKAVGGNKGFKDFLAYANENAVGVYPDFDFSYLKKAENFDGIGNKDLVKTMDNRYTSKRIYNSTMQEFEKTTYFAVSPRSFDRLYNAFNKNYSKFSPTALSVSTLGSDLNSDFNKEEPYNREDTKSLTQGVLEKMSNDYAKVLSDSANAYTLAHVDSYLNVPLDSSNYLYTSESVPFMGMVLHGYKDFTGTALNMAGDIDYQILKSIENGASVYFILSQDNTRLLKESEDLNKYYSVGFDIWHDDLVETYHTLNDALSDCQDAIIEDHEFIYGERIPTDEEAAQDKIDSEAAAVALAESNEKSYAKELLKLKREAYVNGQDPNAVVLDKAAFIASITTALEEETAEENGDGYAKTKYTTDDGKVCIVTYSNGTKFVLNYNSFDITAVCDGETYEIKALGFVKI